MGYNHIALSIKNDSKGFFEKLGFSHYRNECYLKYNGETLFSSNIAKNVNKLLPLQKHIKKNDQLSPVARKYFRQKILLARYNVDIELCDPKLTRYFTNTNGDVLGYIPFCISKDGGITNTDIYTTNNKEARLALPAMLVDILFWSDDIQIDPNSNVGLVITYESNLLAFEQGFGEPNINHSVEILAI